MSQAIADGQQQSSSEQTAHAKPIVIHLSLPPTTNNLFAGNGKRRYRTPQYVAWAKEAGWILASQRPPKALGHVSLLIEVGEPKTNRAQDLSNRLKAVEDLLVSHGVIEGDDQRFVRRIILEWADIDGVRVVVTPI